MSAASPESTLPRRFVLYLPTELAEGSALSEMIQRVLCKRLGGVTSYPARGTFRMADGRLTSEAVQVLEAYCEASEWPNQHPFLIALAQVAGAVLNQESIACAIDGRMQVVTPSARQGGSSVRSDAVPASEKALTDLVVRQLAQP